QSFYYNYFKDTKTEQAIVNKFNNGGVISGTSAGMAILSEVIYAALGNSLYPDDVLQNFKDPDITLRNDFLPFLPGFVVDSHLTERGRGARLMAFMANWYAATGEMLTGIGVDDRTALCIHPNNTAQVFGTGTVSFYSAAQIDAFNDTKMISDSVHVVQLLHGHSINLQTLEILAGPAETLVPAKPAETGNYQVILSGSESLSSNQTMLTYFVQEAGAATDSITVVTAPGKAGSIINRLQTLGAFVIVVETAAASNDASQAEMRNLIRKSKKVLFAENDEAGLFTFLNNGPTGTLLYNHIRRNGMITAFVGEDSRYAGKTFVTNHLTDELAAYYGRLKFTEGLNLLATSTIISNTYDASSTTFYENTTAAGPFGLVSAALKFGIYLNRNSYLRFYQQNGMNFWKSTGNFSSIVAVNSGSTNAELASQPVNSAGATRNYVGFSALRYVLLNGNEQLLAGIPQPADDEPYTPEEIITATPEEKVLSLKVFPNPSESGIFHVRMNPAHSQSTMTVYDQFGKILQVQNSTENDVIDLSARAAGMYYLTLVSGKKIITLKLIR
ncbi:MAG TPA: T9SS type A sorting domain-containing protein, partial [Cyclobacteriaceae bacterium]|nr:T9SS type A sorting domain-containing protein [Cyclobacteriaceae bacterium]